MAGALIHTKFAAKAFVTVRMRVLGGLIVHLWINLAVRAGIKKAMVIMVYLLVPLVVFIV